MHARKLLPMAILNRAFGGAMRATRPAEVRRILALLLLVATGSTPGRSETLYWSGTGTWNLTNRNWGTTSGGGYDQPIWKNSPPDDAVFEGTAGTVTLETGITAGSLAFDITGCTVTGNTLTLSGANSVGGVTLSGGVLNINSAGALGSGTFTIGAGTIINNTSGAAIANSNNNSISLGSDFSFTGSNALDLGTGPVTRTTDLRIDGTSDSTRFGNHDDRLNILRADDGVGLPTASNLQWNNGRGVFETGIDLVRPAGTGAG